MSRATELVSLLKDKSDDPRYAVCYARGTVFKAEGNFFRVEKGKRSVISRALCLLGYYNSRCKICPNRTFSIRLVARGPHV